jgi:L-fuculose-phosphate aldolase
MGKNIVHNRAQVSREIIDICHLLASKGFVSATDGNVSARLPNGNILTTCTTINKGKVGKEHLVEVNCDGDVVRGEFPPSTELPMHLYIYSARTDVGGVVHAHPVYATAFAAAGVDFPWDVFPEVVRELGEVPLAKYATPATKEVPDSMAPYIKKSSAFLLANHGAVTCGKDLWQAYYRMEKLEHAAHILFAARMLGGEIQLNRSDVLKLLRNS